MGAGGPPIGGERAFPIPVTGKAATVEGLARVVPRVSNRFHVIRKGLIMTQAAAMLETYPAELGGVDRDALVACIRACVDCAQACTACADACLSEKSVADLRTCVRSNLDCADLCETTARVLSRHTGYDANLTRTVLQACAMACKACGDECGHHGEMGMRHCEICAEACRRCEQACNELLGKL
jgi:hypothetical protein